MKLVKQILIIVTCIILVAVIGGCSQEKVEGYAKELLYKDRGNKDIDEAEFKDPFDQSNYYSKQDQVELVEDEQQITWSLGDVKVTATKEIIASEIEAEESSSGETSDQSEATENTGNAPLKDVKVSALNKSYNIELDSAIYRVSAMSCSFDRTWIAISFVTDVGETLILHRLSSDEQINVNMELKPEQSFENITAFNWSPDHNVIALSFGDKEQTQIGVYFVEQKELEIAPYSNSFLSTAVIVWSKNGLNVVFASEYETNLYKLYRYSLSNSVVAVLADVSFKELNKLKQLMPAV